MQTKESVCESLARAAWVLTQYEPEKDITGIAHRLATRAGGEWSDIRDGILAGLRSLTEIDQYHESSAAELACIGYCEMGDTDCYWWTNGGESDWSADRPEWWDDQIEQWSEQAC
jgi:hypothetical protein